jgi:hypothetical protein
MTLVAPAPNPSTVGDIYAELNEANREISELIQFIEMTEAFTNDKQTQARIQTFMREKGYWPKKTNS